MRRDEAMNLLKQHRTEFTRFNVKSLSLFGSVARDEAGPSSDIDVLVEFNGPARFDDYMDLKFFLEDLTGRRVDLVTNRSLHPGLRPYVERDLLRVA